MLGGVVRYAKVTLAGGVTYKPHPTPPHLHVGYPQTSQKHLKSKRMKFSRAELFNTVFVTFNNHSFLPKLQG